jgi:(p)ppGpp synthase/HD superfamily hydrolase
MKKGEALAKMIKICVEKFDGHYDKGGQPYILHCLKVMHYLQSEDEDEQCAAVGHDLIEDIFKDNHEAGYAYLRREGFNDRVIHLIRNLTKVEGETEEQYVAKVISDRGSIRIKKADLRHNSDIRRLKGLTEKDFARTQKYHRMYHALLEAEQAYR